MFQWINDLLAWVARFVPQLLVVRRTHAGVAFVRGKYPKALRPGIHIFWPIWTSITIYPTVLQSADLAEQTLITKDGKTVAVNGVVLYEVTDILALLTTIFEPDRLLKDYCLAAVKRVVCERTLEELLADNTKLDRMLTGRMRRRFAKYGINIVRATLTDTAPCKVWKLWGFDRPTMQYDSVG